MSILTEIKKSFSQLGMMEVQDKLVGRELQSGKSQDLHQAWNIEFYNCLMVD